MRALCPLSTHCGHWPSGYPSVMEAIDDRLVAALKSASNELGFRLVSPFDAVDVNGRPLRLEAHLPDFGGPDGIALVSFQRRIKFGDLALPMSILSADYRKYRRKLFVSALSDWGWHGVGPPPGWLKS